MGLLENLATFKTLNVGDGSGGEGGGEVNIK